MVRLKRAGGAKTYKNFEIVVRSRKFNKNFDTNKNFDAVRSPSKDINKHNTKNAGGVTLPPKRVNEPK